MTKNNEHLCTVGSDEVWMFSASVWGEIWGPEIKAKIDMSFPPTDDDLTRLESRPAKNSSLKWLVSFMDAPAINISPDANRQHIGLGLLWNEDHPERLRVNLSKTSLREMVSRIDGEELFLEYVPLGSSFEVAIGI